MVVLLLDGNLTPVPRPDPAAPTVLDAFHAVCRAIPLPSSWTFVTLSPDLTIVHFWYYTSFPGSLVCVYYRHLRATCWSCGVVRVPRACYLLTAHTPLPPPVVQVTVDHWRTFRDAPVTTALLRAWFTVRHLCSPRGAALIYGR